MSKKLLEESTIRSFMKLANLQPLTDKFLKEAEEKAEEAEEEEEEEEEKEKMEESAPPDTEETAHSRDRLEEETHEEDSAELEEGKESEGRPASPKHKVKGVAKPAKVKGAHADHKMKPLSTGSHHSDKSDSVEAGPKSNAPKKNNSQFEVVSESMDGDSIGEGYMDEEMEDAPPADDMGSSGESPDHKEKMKARIRDILNSLKDIGSEYGMSMEISDEGAGPESPEGEPESPEGESPEELGKGPPMMEEKLDEIVEKLTKRVASRLVKESKKKS